MAIGTATALLGGALIGGAASLFGGDNAASAAKSAASQQAAAADQATAEQQREFDQIQQNNAPFLQTGTAANQQLGQLLGLGSNNMENMPTYGSSDSSSGGYGSLAQPFTLADFQADPGYQFTLQQGQQALNRAASAGGKYFSGAAIKGLTDYNQNAASTQYQTAYNNYNTNQTNLYNRLAGVSGAGQTASSSDATAGTNAANQISSNITGAGNAQAAGTVGQANAWSTGLNGIGNDALFSATMYGLNPNYRGVSGSNYATAYGTNGNSSDSGVLSSLGY